jgi:hypothetical protein
MRTAMRISMFLVLLASFSFGGCGYDFIVPISIQNNGPKTDQYRMVMEYVPNANITKEDASPIWDLGRHAFKKGADRLVVIGRYTSYADKDDSDNPLPGTVRDRKLERVWITIPGDMELGKSMKLEELADEFYTGYDVNNLDGKGSFVGPYMIKGFMNLIEVTETKATVKFDIEIRPNRPFQAENWKVTGTHEIDIIPEGRIANQTVSRDIEVAGGTPSNAGDPPTNNGGTNTTPKGPIVNSNGGEAGTTQVAVKTNGIKLGKDGVVIGKWIADNPDFEWRFQFQQDGRFVFSTTRGGGAYDPGMRYGTYTVKKSPTTGTTWVVMLVEKYVFGTLDHMKHIRKSENEVPKIMLRAGWKGEDLVLTGDLLFGPRKPRTIELKKTVFQDLHKVRPPKGRGFSQR